MFHKEVFWAYTLLDLYTSDLVEFVQSAAVYMYAGDTTVYCIGESIDEVSASLNESLKELYAWCSINKLNYHPKKSECMLISRESITGPLLPILLKGYCLNWVKYGTLLGDIFDKLSLSSHVSDLKKNRLCKKKKSPIKKCTFLPKHVLLNLYYKVIIPSLTYGRAVCGESATKTIRCTWKITLQGSKDHLQLFHRQKYFPALNVTIEKVQVIDPKAHL